MSKTLTTREVAKLVGVHPQTVVIWRSWGKGPKFFKQGRLVRYKWADVKKYRRANA